MAMDVLVVGAGPVGLVAACELARRGVRVRIADKLVLVADRPDAVPGYEAVVADPGRAVAARYGFERGGRAVIRPDGYLGLIGDLSADVDAYFAQLLG